MKFEEFPLIVPSEKKIVKKGKKLLEDFKSAKSNEEAYKAYKKFEKFGEEIATQFTTIQVNFTLDTRNETYKHAQEVLDEVGPVITGVNTEFSKAMLASPYRPFLEEKLGSFLFKKYENSIKCFDEKIIPLLIEENKLVNQYEALISAAQIEFDGKIYNIPQLGKFAESLDRDIRKRSQEASWKYFADHEIELGDIYSKLVLCRDKMAKELGYKNYVELGYLRLGRTDYNSEDVKGYREQILKSVTPIVKKLEKRRLARIDVDKPRFYDGAISFKTGNPTPKGDTAYKVNQAKIMFKEMSPETDEFFTFMNENHLLDLEARAGKQGGGYMTYFPKYKSPFIFSNFNGTAGDVDVLTHEDGHAFQGYMSKDIKPGEYQSPTLEACEIHSMSMEFFAWPWMKLFFEEQSDKYHFSHLSGAISFLPYGVTVDHFQEWVYENPTATHEERCAKWHELEALYTPYKNNKGSKFLEHGGRWMRQSHIYATAFYYIDYTLAQVVAFQFLNESLKNRNKAWKKYVKLCKLGGKYPFRTLLEKAHLRDPFVDGNVKKAAKPLVKLLKNFDDVNM